MARVLGLLCKALLPPVLVLAVAGAEATTWAANTYPHLPWAICRAALAVGAVAAGLGVIHTTRPQQEQPR